MNMKNSISNEDIEEPLLGNSNKRDFQEDVDDPSLRDDKYEKRRAQQFRKFCCFVLFGIVLFVLGVLGFVFLIWCQWTPIMKILDNHYDFRYDVFNEFPFLKQSYDHWDRFRFVDKCLNGSKPLFEQLTSYSQLLKLRNNHPTFIVLSERWDREDWAEQQLLELNEFTKEAKIQFPDLRVGTLECVTIEEICMKFGRSGNFFFDSDGQLFQGNDYIKFQHTEYLNFVNQSLSLLSKSPKPIALETLLAPHKRNPNLKELSNYREYRQCRDSNNDAFVYFYRSSRTFEPIGQNLTLWNDFAGSMADLDPTVCVGVFDFDRYDNSEDKLTNQVKLLFEGVPSLRHYRNATHKPHIRSAFYDFCKRVNGHHQYGDRKC